MFSRSGLATTIARHFARDTATFSRFLSYRNSMFRGRLSPFDEVIDTITASAS